MSTFSASIMNGYNYWLEFYGEGTRVDRSGDSYKVEVIPNILNKIYFQVYTFENNVKVPVEFTGAQLYKNTFMINDYIQHWHNGRGFFEFVPTFDEEDFYQIQVYRDFASGFQLNKFFMIDMKIRLDLSVGLSIVNVFNK